MSVTLEEIKFAYRLLLAREGDAGGIEHYGRLAKQGMSLSVLRDDFMASIEFNNKFGYDEKVVDTGDALVVVNANEPEFGRHIATYASWEPHIISIIKRHLKRGDTFVDVGANIGVMAFTAASIVGQEGRVLAFEPHPDNIRLFLKGVAANGFEQVTLHGFALSSEQNVFSLIGSSNGYLMPMGQTVFQAIAIPGDAILASLPKIDFVKIDIEGHEPQALKGMSQSLRRHRPKVLCEFNPRCLKDHVGCHPGDFASNLFELSNIIEVIEHNGETTIIKNGKDLMELWKTKNEEAVRTEFLPDGMVHFDLLFQIDK